MALTVQEVEDILSEIKFPFGFAAGPVKESVRPDLIDICLLMPPVDLYVKGNPVVKPVEGINTMMRIPLPETAEDVYAAITALATWTMTHEMLEQCSNNGQRVFNPHCSEPFEEHDSLEWSKDMAVQYTRLVMMPMPRLEPV